MKKILIVGQNSFVQQHLLYWLRDEDIDLFITDRIEPYSDKKFDVVVFFPTMWDELPELQRPKKEILFRFPFETLERALKLSYKHFIYIDHSYQTDFLNPSYKEFSSLGRKITEVMSNLLNKSYKIVYLYDLVGQRYTDFWDLETNIQYKMQVSFPVLPNQLEYHFAYKNKFYVYIADAVRALIGIIKSCMNEDDFSKNQEEHIRYDNEGFPVNQVVELFEKTNQVVFTKTNITFNDERAPFHGEPSYFLKDFKTNEKIWLQVRRMAS